MGSAYSDGLENGSEEAVRTFYNNLILEATDNGDYRLLDTLLNELAVVEPMVTTYLEHISVANVEREVQFYGLEHLGYTDNGRMDGLQRSHDGTFMIIENKLKGRWGKAEIMALDMDEQITSYVYNLCRMEGCDPRDVQVRYEVAKKPALRKRQGDTDLMFRHRVKQDILSRPDFYHSVHMTSRTQAQLDEFESRFKSIARQVDTETRLEEWVQTPSACSDFGGCDFLPICTRNDISGFKFKGD